jgi:hypothetical protein
LRIEPGKRFVGHPQALSHNESSSIVVADAKSTTAHHGAGGHLRLRLLRIDQWIAAQSAPS